MAYEFEDFLSAEVARAIFEYLGMYKYDRLTKSTTSMDISKQLNKRPRDVNEALSRLHSSGIIEHEDGRVYLSKDGVKAHNYYNSFKNFFEDKFKLMLC